METLLDQFEQKSHEYDLLEKDTFYQWRHTLNTFAHLIVHNV